MANNKLWEQFKVEEFTRGTSGILIDLIYFIKLRAKDCVKLNDLKSVKEYKLEERYLSECLEKINNINTTYIYGQE